MKNLNKNKTELKKSVAYKKGYISSHIVVSSENATWYFPGNVHLLKCFPIKVPALIHLIAQIKISKFLFALISKKTDLKCS